MVNPNIVINGYWDGQPIWRAKTSGELLAEALFKEAQSKVRKIRVTDKSPYTEHITPKIV